MELNNLNVALLYLKAMVGWEPRMWKRRPGGKPLSALEQLRIEIQVSINFRDGV